MCIMTLFMWNYIQLVVSTARGVEGAHQTANNGHLRAVKLFPCCLNFLLQIRYKQKKHLLKQKFHKGFNDIGYVYDM